MLSIVDYFRSVELRLLLVDRRENSLVLRAGTGRESNLWQRGDRDILLLQRVGMMEKFCF